MAPVLWPLFLLAEVTKIVQEKSRINWKKKKVYESLSLQHRVQIKKVNLFKLLK